MSGDRKCTKIEIRFDDGLVERAEGDEADGIWRWFRAGESMNMIHGAEYKGKPISRWIEKPCWACAELRASGYQLTTCEECCGSGIIKSDVK